MSRRKYRLLRQCAMKAIDELSAEERTTLIEKIKQDEFDGWMSDLEVDRVSTIRDLVNEGYQGWNVETTSDNQIAWRLVNQYVAAMEEQDVDEPYDDRWPDSLRSVMLVMEKYWIEKGGTSVRKA